MAIQLTDLLLINRGGVHYKATAQDMITLAQDNLGTVEYTAADITARDALTGLTDGDRVFTTDASGDATVASGWAVYRYNSGAFTKIAEQESLDVSLVANLSYVAAPSGGTVNVDTGGTGATIPDVDGTNAGLATPAMFNNSHVAATLTGAATTKLLTLTGQQLGFDIAQLTTAP